MASGVSVVSEAEDQTSLRSTSADDLVYMTADHIESSSSKRQGYMGSVEALKQELMKFGNSRQCQLRLQIDFLEFSEAEADAAQRNAGNNSTASNEFEYLSPRARKFLNGGMLYVTLNKAIDLRSTQSITKKFRVVVSIRERDHPAIMEKVAERTGIGKGLNAKEPIFDQTVDLLIDGDNANRANMLLRVEVFVVPVAKKPKLRGFVEIELKKIIEAGRMRDTWKLEQSPRGHIDMHLEWLRTLESAM